MDGGSRGGAGSAGVGPRLRTARPDDLRQCTEIWREAMGGYLGRLNIIPPEGDLGSLARLLGHLLATDPERFVVAEDTSVERLVGFGSATMRGHVWFLAMLFVSPESQTEGLGTRMLSLISPRPSSDRDAGPGGDITPRVRATITDSAQPVSNAMYGRMGIVPRVPLMHLVGRPERGAMPALPPGIAAEPLDPPGRADNPDDAAIGAVDEALLGYRHPEDHAYLWRDGRAGFLYRAPDRSVVGYGYGAPSGRVGPVAALDRDMLPPILGHLLAAFEPRGASSVWVPGSADQIVTALLGSGFRLDPFPALLCWDEPFAEFERYLPASLALL